MLLVAGYCLLMSRHNQYHVNIVDKNNPKELINIRSAEGRINPKTGLIELQMEGSSMHEYGAGQYMTRILIASMAYILSAAGILFAIGATFGEAGSPDNLLRLGVMSWSMFLFFVFTLCVGDPIVLPLIGHLSVCSVLFFYYKTIAGIHTLALDQPTLLLIGFTVGVPTIVWVLSMAIMMGARYGTNRIARHRVMLTLFGSLILASGLIVYVLQLHGVDLISLTISKNVKSFAPTVQETSVEQIPEHELSIVLAEPVQEISEEHSEDIF